MYTFSYDTISTSTRFLRTRRIIKQVIIYDIS